MDPCVCGVGYTRAGRISSRYPKKESKNQRMLALLLSLTHMWIGNTDDAEVPTGNSGSITWGRGVP